MSKSSMKPPITSWGLRDYGNIIAIVGAPGSGKTALMYTIADAIHRNRTVFVVMTKQFGRPEHYKPWDGQMYREYCVVAVNDASGFFHARDWSEKKSVMLSTFQSVRRHKGVDFIWDVQNTGDLDVTILRQVDCMIFRQPSLMQADFERPAMRKRWEEAELEMKGNWSHDRAYVMTHKKKFILEGIEMPSYYNDEISTDDVVLKDGSIDQPKESISDRVRRILS